MKNQNSKSQIETPRYYLADVPHHIRARALDLCIRRLWHDALELLQTHGFNDYTQDDLISFYHWAPARLEPDLPEPEPTPECPRDYEQPAPELLEDIRKRLADVPPDVLERVHDTLKHGSIEQAGSLLWHAGAGFSSADLYQYRITLFPPKSLVDPYTAGPPVLRPEKSGSMDSGMNGLSGDETSGLTTPDNTVKEEAALVQESTHPPDRSADSLSAFSPATNTPDGSADSLSAPPSETNNSPDAVSPSLSSSSSCSSSSSNSLDHNGPRTTDDGQLIESRQRLVNVLSARLNALNSPVSSSSCSSSSSIASVKPPRTTRHARQRITNHAPRTTENKPLITEPGHLLLDSIRDVLTRYVVLPELAAEALALWVVHTYAFTLREVTTYIGVVSPEKRCGKTTLLELLGRLANRSLTAANISPSALFRVIQDTQPTLLIDEADTFLQGRDELAGILNAGYRKGNAYVVRLSDSRTRWRIASRKPEFGEWTQKCGDDFAQYSCWCPKVMAAIGRLPDTLADRCILITIATQNARRKMRAYAPLESH